MATSSTAFNVLLRLIPPLEWPQCELKQKHKSPSSRLTWLSLQGRIRIQSQRARGFPFGFGDRNQSRERRALRWASCEVRIGQTVPKNEVNEEEVISSMGSLLPVELWKIFMPKMGLKFDRRLNFVSISLSLRFTFAGWPLSLPTILYFSAACIIVKNPGSSFPLQSLFNRYSSLSQQLSSYLFRLATGNLCKIRNK